MEAKDWISLIGGIAGAIAFLFTAWNQLRRVGPQNTLDDSIAADNFRKLAVEIRAETKKEIDQYRSEIRELRDTIESSHLEVKLEIEMGNAPVIRGWEWKQREKTVKIPSVAGKA